MPIFSATNILKSIPTKKVEIALILSVVSTIFYIGRSSVPMPDKDTYCKVYTDKISNKDREIAQLRSENTLLRSQIQEAEDSCDRRLREITDTKDAQYTKDLAVALEKQKERFLGFKCRNCKKLGLCK